MEYNEYLKIKLSKFKKLVIPTLEGYNLVDPSDIVYLRADINYTFIFFDDGKKIHSSKNIGYFDEQLLEEPFIRIHSSTIVNLHKVKSFIRADNGWIIMKNGENLKVSKNKKDDLLFFFKATKQNNQP